MPGKTLLHTLSYLLRVEPAATQLTDSELNCLVKYAKGSKTGAEIGVFEGASTSVIAKQFSDDGVLYAVDPFFPGRMGVCWGEVIARRQVKRANVVSRVKFIKALSYDAVKMIQEDFDFVFIDADHSLEGITRDWSDWSARIKQNGIIALHDVCVAQHNRGTRLFGSYQYFDSHIQYDDRFHIVEKVDSLCVLRKK